MTHKDKLRTGYSKAFEDGWDKIKDNRISCKSCTELISKFYAKKHDGLCIKCWNEQRKNNGS